MLIWGVSDGFHDASLSVIDDENILFAGHSERYSKVKGDKFLNADIVNEALQYGVPEKIAYYEKPFLKKSRLFFGGIDGHSTISNYLDTPTYNVSHHKSHAAAGYFTSPFDQALIVVLDSIGEWNTCSIWKAKGDNLKKIYSKNYPFSFGLFYSAFTQLIGLKPNEEEYILMGMSGYGQKQRFLKKVERYFPSIKHQAYNFHKGIFDWSEVISEKDKFDIAAAVQEVYEKRLLEFLQFAKQFDKTENLVFMGGCALNCSANTLLKNMFENIWIMPNPGDAGSSLGAAAAMHGKRLNWQGPYLGTKISGNYPIKSCLQNLMSGGIVGVANGRSEYGPRALGNRSLLADPRGNAKQAVNLIKMREQFRPFAPVVLEEDATDWFDLDRPSPYMQYAVKCKRPNEIPAVVHVDGTSRVQTVNRNQNQGLYDLLTLWKKNTGIPILLNTSLNVKGQPLINDMEDVARWKSVHPEVPIVCKEI